MADHVNYDNTKPVSDEPCEGTTTAVAVESTDRGLFGFGGKKEEAKCEETPIASEFEEKVKVSEEPVKEEEKKHEGLIEKLRRSDSSSSSSSEEEEVGEDGLKKKKKKKGLKEKIVGEKEKEKKAECEDTSVPVEKYEEHEEKKGFLDKIKDKLPGGKKTEEVAAPPPPAPVVADYSEAEGKEKKGFLDKIKEKLPGYHPKSDEEKEKEKEKEGAC
ncbi:phosphoprotein ECPP44-like [Salvia splendens]|uniref:phosphoprotein ECPP44-like n=1 Tax=Salvia splendens TaxID=180675 RepID=UPI001C27A5FB|nr:phosphoprotein ECPP44-like [Salvia splendens]